MSLTVTGDDVWVEINHNTPPATANFRVAHDGDWDDPAPVLFDIDKSGWIKTTGNLVRTDDPVEFDRTGSSGPIVDFGTVSAGPTFSPVAKINEYGQGVFNQGGVILPIDTGGGPGGGSLGDIRLSWNTSTSQYYLRVYTSSGWQGIELPN